MWSIITFAIAVGFQYDSREKKHDGESKTLYFKNMGI